MPIVATIEFKIAITVSGQGIPEHNVGNVSYMIIVLLKEWIITNLFYFDNNGVENGVVSHKWKMQNE